jgi:hypothetical protein
MWQQDDDDRKRLGDEAREYAASLSLADYMEWRLPSVEELCSLWRNLGHHKTIAKKYFPNLKVVSEAHYLSSSQCDGVFFDNGEVIHTGGPVWGLVRCVRDTRTLVEWLNDFDDSGGGTVTDKKTGLMWQKDDDDRRRLWSESQEYAASLSLAGYMDWRLPSREELLSLWRNGVHRPEIKATFFPGLKFRYWSSTSRLLESPRKAWCVEFFGGGGHWHLENISDWTAYVLCVRGGE